jgi:hypothetical protein
MEVWDALGRPRLLAFPWCPSGRFIPAFQLPFPSREEAKSCYRSRASPITGYRGRPRQMQVLRTIGHCHLDRASLEDLSHLLPRQPLRSSSPETRRRPGSPDACPPPRASPPPVLRSAYTPSAVVHLHAAKRHELEAAGGQPVVPRAALPPTRTHRPAIGPRMQFHFRVGDGAPSIQRTAPYRNNLNFWTKLRMVLSYIPFPSL